MGPAAAVAALLAAASLALASTSVSNSSKRVIDPLTASAVTNDCATLFLNRASSDVTCMRADVSERCEPCATAKRHSKTTFTRC